MVYTHGIHIHIAYPLHIPIPIVIRSTYMHRSAYPTHNVVQRMRYAYSTPNLCTQCSPTAQLYVYTCASHTFLYPYIESLHLPHTQCAEEDDALLIPHTPCMRTMQLNCSAVCRHMPIIYTHTCELYACTHTHMYDDTFNIPYTQCAVCRHMPITYTHTCPLYTPTHTHMYEDTFDIPYTQSADDDDALHIFYTQCNHTK